jgi:hypothetical protein
MANKIKFELNRKGVSELLKGNEMQDLISDEVSRVKSNCGDEYASSVKVGRDRVQGFVETATEHAFFSNLHNNTLLKGLK